LGWKADTCKLQTHHSEYGSHCQAQKLAQTQSDIEENVVSKEFGPNGG